MPNDIFPGQRIPHRPYPQHTNQMLRFPRHILEFCRPFVSTDVLCRKIQNQNSNQLISQKIGVLKSCLGRIRTLTGGTRIRRATITPQGNFMSVKGGKIRLDDETSKRHVFLCLMTCRYKLFALFPFDGAKVGVIFESYKYFLIFFMDVR